MACTHRYRYRNRYRLLRTDTTNCDCDPDTDSDTGVDGFLLLFSEQSAPGRVAAKPHPANLLIGSAFICVFLRLLSSRIERFRVCVFSKRSITMAAPTD
jgi:hypothetical protein